MTQLKKLSLDGTKISDIGLGHLRGLLNLEELRICGTPITTAGLDHLKVLTKLKRLVLSNVYIEESRIINLQNAILSLKIAR